MMFKDVVAKAVSRAVRNIQWERDPFAIVETLPVPGKPLETAITIKMRHTS